MLKRRMIYDQLRENKADIIMLQETHNCKNTEKLWKCEWGLNWYNSNGTSNARGVSILFSSQVSRVAKNIRLRKDESGRLLILTLEINDKTLVLCNLYGPNIDDPNFYNDVIAKLTDLEFDHIIIGGDFNFVLDNDMDSYNRTESHRASKAIIMKLMEEANLCDIWRDINPSERKYTWRKNNPRLICSRLDWFLINSESSTCVESCNITPTLKTDHSMISIVLKIDELDRGPGTWRLNVLHLNNERFVENVKNIIRSVTKSAHNLDPVEKWEYVKGQLIEYCQKYSKNNAKKINKRKLDLSKMLQILCDDLTTAVHGNEEHVISAIKNIELELESMLKNKVSASAFRSRARFACEGEKSSKYFFNLEKRNYFSKNIRCLHTEDGRVISEQNRILREQRNFYKTLYQKDDNVSFQLRPTQNERVLDSSQIAALDAPLTQEEMFAALKDMKNNKFPGLDGLPKEFYLQFFEELGPLLCNLYKFCYERGELNPSARRGLISLIPKRNKNAKILSHYRPLTLLSMDYKILSKVMAERIKKVLPSIICEEQVGFMAGRNVATILRKSFEVIKYTKQNRIPSAIMNIDFAKCFDRISHSALSGSLEYYGFPPSYVKWVMLFFTNLQIYTQNFGHLSSPFTKSRGSNQGCNISPFCYLLCGEILARKLKENTNIKGITMKDAKILLSQFADDTTLYLSYDDLTFQSVMQVLSHIEKNTGLCISYEKTVVYRIGSIANSNAKIYTRKQLSWTNEPVNMLGISLNNDYDSILDHESTLKKMKLTLDNWYNRTLTLMGKVLIVNTLCESLFVYKLTVLPDLDKSMIQKVDEIIFNYLWCGKRARISKNTLRASKGSGGLRLFDIEKKQSALKMSWVPIIMKDDFFMKCFVNCININERLYPLIFELNVKPSDARHMCNPKDFWGQVWIAWCNHNYTAKIRPNQIIWYNSNIKIDGKLVYLPNCINKGLLYVKDFPITYTNVRTSGMMWIQHAAMLRIVRDFVNCMDDQVSNISKIIGLEKVSSVVYRRSIDCEYSIFAKYASRWNEYGIIIETSELNKGFANLYRVTSITKFRNFQYRLLLGKIPTNVDLKAWNMNTSDSCTFCNSQPESITHLFLECIFVKRIWNFITLYIDIHPLNIKNIILNYTNANGSHICNLIVLVFKQYIYRK